MVYVLDFHFHSSFSDGKGTPDAIVSAALAKDQRVRHLALSDHNTFQGCRAFLTACKSKGIEGFVSCELSGSHPDYRDREFHFLINVGHVWNERVRDRTRQFTPYFERLHQTEAENATLFFDLLEAQGESRDVIGEGRGIIDATRLLYSSDNPPSDGVSLFQTIRRWSGNKKLPETYGVKTPLELEKKLWASAGRYPAPTPVINDAFGIIRKTKPCVTLAHPHKYDLEPAALKPLLIEWKESIGLTALELHYGGEFLSAYQPLADELGLLISAGSDSHSMWTAKARGQASDALPVIEGDLIENIERLLERLRRAATD